MSVKIMSVITKSVIIMSDNQVLVRDQTFKKCQSLAFRVKSVFSTVIGSLDDVENI